MGKLRDLYICVTASQAQSIAKEGLSSIARLAGPHEGDPIVHGIVCGTDPVDVLFDAPSDDKVLLHIDATRIPEISSWTSHKGDANPSQNILACGRHRFTVPPSEITFLDEYRLDPITALAA